jgi:hypothetical protein
MKRANCLAAGCLLVTLPSLAGAAPDYDSALEDAAIKLAVSKLGQLRGSFSGDNRPRFYRPAKAAPENERADENGWKDGLAPATDVPRMTTGKP